MVERVDSGNARRAGRSSRPSRTSYWKVNEYLTYWIGGWSGGPLISLPACGPQHLGIAISWQPWLNLPYPLSTDTTRLDNEQVLQSRGLLCPHTSARIPSLFLWATGANGAKEIESVGCSKCADGRQLQT